MIFEHYKPQLTIDEWGEFTSAMGMHEQTAHYEMYAWPLIKFP